jgi:hypothetical protein
MHTCLWLSMDAQRLARDVVYQHAAGSCVLLTSGTQVVEWVLMFHCGSGCAVRHGSLQRLHTACAQRACCCLLTSTRVPLSTHRHDILRCADSAIGLSQFAGSGGWNDPDMLEVCGVRSSLHSKLSPGLCNNPGAGGGYIRAAVLHTRKEADTESRICAALL